jgi:hypothetical protein
MKILIQVMAIIYISIVSLWFLLFFLALLGKEINYPLTVVIPSVSFVFFELSAVFFLVAAIKNKSGWGAGKYFILAGICLLLFICGFIISKPINTKIIGGNEKSSEKAEKDIAPIKRLQSAQTTSEKIIREESTNSAELAERVESTSKEVTTEKVESTSKEATTEKTVAETTPPSDFSPSDTSDSTIRQISTYGDYLTMYYLITQNFISDYSSLFVQTGLYSQEDLSSIKSQYEQGYREVEKQYSSMRNMPLSGKETFVQMLISYRNNCNQYISAMDSYMGNYEDILDQYGLSW